MELKSDHPPQHRAEPSPACRSLSCRGRGRWRFSCCLPRLPYAGILRNDFVYIYDDKAQIIDNPYVHNLRAPAGSAHHHRFGRLETPGRTNYYRPVMTIGFLLCYQVLRSMAYGFHLASLLLHAAVVAVLFLFAERLFRDRGAALGAAGLFALHPDSRRVGGVDFRRDRPGGDSLLSAHFLVFLAGRRRQRGRTASGPQAAMAVSFLLALLSKEQALTLALLAVIYEHFYRDDRG